MPLSFLYHAPTPEPRPAAAARKSMMTRVPSLLLALLLGLVFLPLLAQQSEDGEDGEDLPFVRIQRVENLQDLGRQARREGKIILMEVEASDCPYCRRLEEEILKPMLRSGDYEDNTLIVQLEIDSYADLVDWNGRKTTLAEFSQRYGVFVTPTLLFLDPQGREVSKRIVGINSVDFFGAYVDEALAEGRRRIQADTAYHKTETENP